jgi:Protein of unknown function (DUF1553)/Protein of unknown function (DUF1549)/Planctomycete cytochrome C
MRRVLLSAVVALAASSGSAADRTVSFSGEVQPIFEKSCWNCHSASIQLSKLSLATRNDVLKGGEHGVVAIPGIAEKSRLYKLISGAEKPSMPIGGKLTPAEIETIRLWINQGLVWDRAPAVSEAAPAGRPAVVVEAPILPEGRNYWAFRLPVRPPLPRMDANPIDAFIRSKLDAQGIRPAPQADQVTLLRRAYLDLIGLPPTPAEVAEFLRDRSPRAWERLIDRLLASPHYGERWGRHWLDVARYADSNGFEHDFDRPNAWRYRDYVIRSFNEDKPWNTFLREQIAGDELTQVTYDGLIATGFLRSYAKVGFREKDNPEFRYEYLDDMIATIGRGILGLTVQCARCHDHKFDPIRQEDYYRLQASLWGYVEVDQPLVPKKQAEEWTKTNAEIDARIADLRLQLRTLEKPYRDELLPAKYKRFPQNIQDAIATPEDKRTPGQALLALQVIRTVAVSDTEVNRIISPADKAEKQRILGLIEAMEKQRPAPIPLAMAVTDGDYRFTPDGPGDEPAPGKGKKHEAIEGSYLHTGEGRYQVPPSYFLVRGDVNGHGHATQPGFIKVITRGDPPAELPPATPHTSGRRLALAEWLISRENPLTARVIVNRIWHHHFGPGIVATLDNFGKNGEAPVNPELLDWLAVEFMDRGWSVKQLHRLIMTSDTYKMASEFQDSETLAANIAKDPDNRLEWRRRVQRMDAEIIRDSILAVSGTLNPEIGGRPVFPVLAPEILKQISSGIWKQKEEGPEVWRRSVYIYRKRTLPFPFMDAFDLPNQSISCGARNVTTVPTQALTLMNDDFTLGQSKLFANRLEEAAPGDKAKQIALAYSIALSRAPNAEERRLAEDFLASRTLADFTSVIFNLNEFLYAR